MARSPRDRRLAIFRARSHGYKPPAGFLVGARLARAARLLQRVAHLGEYRADLRADILDGHNDEDRDQARDQRILDRRHAKFIAKEVLNSSHISAQDSAGQFKKSIPPLPLDIPCIAPSCLIVA